jgi:hypothetical protein
LLMNSSHWLRLRLQLTNRLEISSSTDIPGAQANLVMPSTSASTPTLTFWLDGLSDKVQLMPLTMLEELTMFHLLLSFKYMEDSTFQFPHTLLKLVMESTFKLLTLNFQLTWQLDKIQFATALSLASSLLLSTLKSALLFFNACGMWLLLNPVFAHLWLDQSSNNSSGPSLMDITWLWLYLDAFISDK